jgi:gamma-glutamyltranspeptidase/glutathione hydrolase
MKRSQKWSAVLGAGCLVLASCGRALADDVCCASDLAAWEKYGDLPEGESNPMAVGTHGAVAGTVGGAAVGAGLELLQRGGSAADAALATALGQTALGAGWFMSYAGYMQVLYYEAASGRVYGLNADWNTVLGEHDPLSIPLSPTTSGRTALVPGFMAGLEAVHRRFGRLPFKAIFAPAIHYTEAGFKVTPRMARLIEKKESQLSRLEASRAFITRRDGQIYQAGDIFRQPATAEALRGVAEHGAAYMYSGPWAKRFVVAVRADGGKMSMEDLRRYRVQWYEPLHFEYEGYEVYSTDESHYLMGALNLLEASGLTKRGDYAQSPEVFVGLHRILRATGDLGRQGSGPGTTPDEDWLDKAKGREIWAQVKAGTFPLPPSSGGAVPTASSPGHSAAVVAVDHWGNIAVVAHSSNSSQMTGLIVDGVPIPDAASFQQGNILRAGPGHRLWAGILPMIALREGRPYAAVCGCVGGGLSQEGVKVLVNMLAYGRDAKQANDAPSLLWPGPRGGGNGDSGEEEPVSDTEAVLEGQFAPELLRGARALGLKVQEKSPEAAGRLRGIIVNLAVNPATGEYSVAAPRFVGRALAY